jgi:hypothetical protein
MQNLYETVKKAQQVVQVEAVRVQKELEEYVTDLLFLCFNFICTVNPSIIIIKPTQYHLQCNRGKSGFLMKKFGFFMFCS